MDQFDEEVKEDFAAHIEKLREDGRLEFPEARKITRDIFEIRIIHEGIFRGFYAYISHPDIIILHFFQKKTSKTPIKNIKLAERRLQKYAQ